MTRRAQSLTILVAGTLIVALSLGADTIGLGNQAGMGWKQWSGTLAGALVALYGAWSLRRKQDQPK